LNSACKRNVKFDEFCHCVCCLLFVVCCLLFVG
jgi:hypothetical protein